jgi:4-hydroxy-3-methylbut-2-enyl diphosphate reductase
MAQEAILKTSGDAYSYGPIIHNPLVVNSLKTKGLKPIENINDVPDGAYLIIRSHGAPPEVYEKARARNMKIEDATCTFVRKAQIRAIELVEQGYHLIIVGKQGHPEVEGIIKHAGSGEVVYSTKQLNVVRSKKIGVVCQTTIPIEVLQKIISKLLLKTSEIRVYNTICSAVRNRQKSAIEIAKNVDAMIIVGGKNSSNTRRLYELCLFRNKNCFHIEEKSELDSLDLNKFDTVGISSGTSTPNWILEEIVRDIEQMYG